jgi:hypothetical protein
MKRFLLIFILSLAFFPVICFAEQIDINSATLSQLDELTGVGPVYAQRIIDGRTYSSVDDLLRVKGIGPATLQKIKTQGWACINCETSLTAQTTTDQSKNPPTTNTDTTQTADTQSPTPATAITYPTGVYINEILPNPQGDDSLDEWIELFNSNNFDVDLSGWQIKDLAGNTSTYTITQDTKILANGYLVFKRPDTKIMLNNDGDGLNLYTPDGKIVDTVSFISAPLGQSYNKTLSDWAWSTTLTPDIQNIITVAEKKTSAKTLSKTKNSAKNDLADKGLADISQSIDSNQDNNTQNNPWFLFFIVLATTIILSTIILIIKLRLKGATATKP